MAETANGHEKSVVQAIYIGKAAKNFGNVTSAFIKRAVSSLEDPVSVSVSRNGLLGDEQGHEIHGGAERAVNHVPARNFAECGQKFRDSVNNDVPDTFDKTFRPCGLGENISTDDDIMNEMTVCIGDVYQLGSTKLEVSQPRFPCTRINMRHGIKQKGTDSLQKFLLGSGRSGWFYRVLEEGEIKAGDQFVLLERKHPEWTVNRVQTLLFGSPQKYGTIEPPIEDPNERQELEELRDLPSLTTFFWEDRCQEKLDGKFKWY